MSSPARPRTDPTITIVLADDHPVVRSGLRILLDANDDFEVVAQAADAAAALRSVVEHEPAVLVLDLNMPGELTALEAIPRVTDRCPGTAVVVLTMEQDPAFARRALDAGALGYVRKDSAAEDLVVAVRRAAAGGRYVVPAANAMPDGAAPAPERSAPALSAREIEVLRLIALGHTNAEIAEQLLLSVRTIESHRAHIQRKLGSSTRAQLVRYALDHDLLDAELRGARKTGRAA